MSGMRLLLAGIALAMMLISVAVFRHRTRATSCPRHSRTAGRIAVVAGWASFVAGIGLFIYALFVVRG